MNSGWTGNLFLTTILWEGNWSRKWVWIYCRNVHLLPWSRLYQDIWWREPGFRIQLQQFSKTHWSHGPFLHFGCWTITNPEITLIALIPVRFLYSSIHFLFMHIVQKVSRWMLLGSGIIDHFLLLNWVYAYIIELNYMF